MTLDLQTLIDKYDWWFHKSELHGIFTGLVALNIKDDWAKLLAKDSQNAPMVVGEIMRKIEESLHSNDFNFSLLLDDDAYLNDYAESLLYWIQGFNLSAQLLLNHSQCTLDEDAQQFLDEMKEFAKLDLNIPDTEESREQLLTLEEHCRMGVLLLYAHTHLR